MEKQTDFRIRSYGRTELAQLYNPCLTPKAAYRKLVGWIDPTMRTFHTPFSPYNTHLSGRTPRNSPLRATAQDEGVIFVVPEREERQGSFTGTVSVFHPNYQL